MSDHCHSELSKILHLLVCLTGALMLVFPVSRVHQRIDHFRAPDIVRSVEMHTSLDRTTGDPWKQRISANHCYLDTVLDAEEELPITLAGIESTPTVPIIRMLLRLKLGPTPSADSDPLL
jgi:hypothetical protein